MVKHCLNYCVLPLSNVNALKFLYSNIYCRPYPIRLFSTNTLKVIQNEHTKRLKFLLNSGSLNVNQNFYCGVRAYTNPIYLCQQSISKRHYSILSNRKTSKSEQTFENRFRNFTDSTNEKSAPLLFAYKARQSWIGFAALCAICGIFWWNINYHKEVETPIVTTKKIIFERIKKDPRVGEILGEPLTFCNETPNRRKRQHGHFKLYLNEEGKKEVDTSFFVKGTKDAIHGRKQSAKVWTQVREAEDGTLSDFVYLLVEFEYDNDHSQILVEDNRKK